MKCTKVATKLPNGHKMYQNGSNKFQMAIEFTNLFHSKALKNLPKLGFLLRKYAIWQPCCETESSLVLPLSSM
jgi:hypothetical protein